MMKNASLTSDVWNNFTSTSSLSSSSTEKIITTIFLALIRDPALKVIYVIMATVGILGNMFVVIVFALFIKITDKVIYQQYSIAYPTAKLLTNVPGVYCIQESRAVAEKPHDAVVNSIPIKIYSGIARFSLR